jgi:hypothetical protein
MPEIIGIERRDKASARRSKRRVTGRSDTLVHLMNEPDPRIRIGYGLNNSRGLVLRAIVDDDYFDRRIALVQSRTECICDRGCGGCEASGSDEGWTVAVAQSYSAVPPSQAVSLQTELGQKSTVFGIAAQSVGRQLWGLSLWALRTKVPLLTRLAIVAFDPQHRHTGTCTFEIDKTNQR